MEIRKMSTHEVYTYCEKLKEDNRKKDERIRSLLKQRDVYNRESEYMASVINNHVSRGINLVNALYMIKRYLEESNRDNFDFSKTYILEIINKQIEIEGDEE